MKLNKLLYSNLTSKFRLIDFSQSHSEMIIRSHKGLGRDYNIDLMFKGVLSMNMSLSFKGIEVYIIDRKGSETVSNIADSKFIFLLKDSEGNVSYIDAAAFGVFENELGYDDSSLGDFTWSEKNISKDWFRGSDFSDMF